MKQLLQFIQEKLVFNKHTKSKTNLPVNTIEDFVNEYNLKIISYPNKKNLNNYIIKTNSNINQCIKDNIFDLWNSNEKYNEQKNFTKEVFTYCKEKFHWSSELLLDIFIVNNIHVDKQSCICIYDENKLSCDIINITYNHDNKWLYLYIKDDIMKDEFIKWSINILEYILDKI